MHSKPLYLKRNVQVEPLVNSWYAWALLIPPATLARLTTDLHMNIMDSYVTAPQIHANAVRNPQMLGGPFIDMDGRRVEEIRKLRKRTIDNQTHLVTLSDALGELDRLLRTEAEGYSLEPLYGQIPDALRGAVELFYDLRNNPSYRLIEPLLYKSPHYDRSLQSLMLSITTGDDRPFILSTPRLRTRGCLEWCTPFDDERVDMLFDLKEKPSPWGAIKEMMVLAGEDAEVMRSFLTSEAPPIYEPYRGSGVRWRYFGHACILIETASVSLLFDPVLSYTYESSVSRFTYSDLPERIDYVLITHNHQDHILFETLLQIRRRIGAIVVPRNGSGELQDPSLKLILQNVGFSNVIEISELEEIGIEGGKVTGLPFFGEHSDLDIRTKMAYLVRLCGCTLLFAADSCNIEPKLYERLQSVVGDADALFLGMECDGAPLSWLYGALMETPLDRGMDQSRRLAGSDYDQAIDIVSRFNFKEVYVYAMGQEPWLNYVMSLKYTTESRPIVHSDRLIAECRKRGIHAERLFGEREIFLDAPTVDGR